MAKKTQFRSISESHFDMFTELLDTINIEIVKALSSVKLEQLGANKKKY
jgi:hypothetical protein